MMEATQRDRDREAGQAPEPMNYAGRQTARQVLLHRAEHYRRRAEHLEKLNAMLPLELTAEQDEALWSILTDLPR